jgi:hypothetical protein
MSDQTETIRRQQVAEINSDPGSRASLEAKHGDVYDTSELQEAFSVLGFLSPYVIVQRKSDLTKGSMQFQHSPRFYFGFSPE